jgi:hypothetical protein
LFEPFLNFLEGGFTVELLRDKKLMLLETKKPLRDGVLHHKGVVLLVIQLADNKIVPKFWVFGRHVSVIRGKRDGKMQF